MGSALVPVRSSSSNLRVDPGGGGVGGGVDDGGGQPADQGQPKDGHASDPNVRGT